MPGLRDGAIATAVLAATALFGAFRTTVESALGSAAHTFSLSVDKPNALVGLIVGAAVVFYFSGLAIMAVGQALAAVTTHRPRPEVDEADHRNPREDARTQNVWLFGA